MIGRQQTEGPNAQPQLPFVQLPFSDRVEAGRALGALLRAHAANHHVVVLALPRGGVPVAYEVARALGAQLDLMIVRKLGFPGQEELAMGAIAIGGVRVINAELAGWVTPELLETVAAREQVELERRQQLYRGERPVLPLRGRVVVLVDDGLATGATMRAAIATVRRSHPAAIVVAVPVAPTQTVDLLRREADEVVCLATPEPFHAIGLWYRDFRQVEDDEVRELLRLAWQSEEAGERQGEPHVWKDREVSIRSAGVELRGVLTIPDGARGLIVFANGSGTSRSSARNRTLAHTFNDDPLATLRLDLLTEREHELDLHTAELRFDIALLTERLVGAIDWLTSQPETADLELGLLGASTGVAAALCAAAQRPERVRAVVGRGGRPDLAAVALRSVRAPTLLIVGSADTALLNLNRQASAQLGFSHVAVVPGASQLFEEPGTLEQVARLATNWFRGHLGASH